MTMGEAKRRRCQYGSACYRQQNPQHRLAFGACLAESSTPLPSPPSPPPLSRCPLCVLTPSNPRCLPASAHPGEPDWEPGKSDADEPRVDGTSRPQYVSIALPSGDKRRYGDADCAKIAAARSRGDKSVALGPARTSGGTALRLEIHFNARGYEMMQLNLDTDNVREVVEVCGEPPAKDASSPDARTGASSKAATEALHTPVSAPESQPCDSGSAAVSAPSTLADSASVAPARMSSGVVDSAGSSSSSDSDRAPSASKSTTPANPALHKGRFGADFGGDFGGGQFSGEIFAGTSFEDVSALPTVHSSGSADTSIDKDFAQLSPDQQAEITRARKLSYNALMGIARESAEAAPSGLPLSSSCCRGMPPGLPMLYREAYAERFRQCYEGRRQ